MSLFQSIQSILMFPVSMESSSSSSTVEDSPMEPSFRDCLITLALLMALVEVFARALCALSKRYPELFQGEGDSSCTYWWQEEETPAQRDARIQRCLNVSIFVALDLPSKAKDAHQGNTDATPTSTSTCCSICLNDFEHKEVVVSGSRKCCNNLYHHSCLSAWLQVQSSCPCCRRDMLFISKNTTATSTPQATPPSAATTTTTTAQRQSNISSCPRISSICRFIRYY